MLKYERYEYFKAICISYERLELLKTMIALFDDLEITDIYEDAVLDKRGYVDYSGWTVVITRDRDKYNGMSKVLVKGFELEEVLA